LLSQNSEADKVSSSTSSRASLQQLLERIEKIESVGAMSKIGQMQHNAEKHHHEPGCCVREEVNTEHSLEKDRIPDNWYNSPQVRLKINGMKIWSLLLVACGCRGPIQQSRLLGSH